MRRDHSHTSQEGEPYESPRIKYFFAKSLNTDPQPLAQKKKTQTKTKNQAKNPFILVLKILVNNLITSIPNYMPLIMRIVANHQKSPWLHTELFLTLQGASYDFPAIF